MDVERKTPARLFPTSALVFSAAGTPVAVVGDDHKIPLRVVEIDGEVGSRIAIATGISASEQIVVNPRDRISEGIAVAIESEQADKPVSGHSKSAD